MFAFFGLGMEEVIVLGILAVLLYAPGLAALIALMIFLTMSKSTAKR